VAGGASARPIFIHAEAAVLDRLRAVGRPGESYSEVIQRLVEMEAHGPSLSKTP
jgi:hypothetical protein